MVKLAAFNFLKETDLVKNFDKDSYHLHVPMGATPKDGPSAGVSLFSSLVSAALNKPVAANLAMTGEISLRGRVLPVGGIREKLLAAVRCGMREVLLPEANRRAWDEVPVEVQKRLKIHWIKNVENMIGVLFK